MFETRIVELAVDRISAHDIEDLRRTITRIEEDPTDAERVRIESNRLHILLAEATRNRMLALLARVIRQIVIRMEHESHGAGALQIARSHPQTSERQLTVLCLWNRPIGKPGAQHSWLSVDRKGFLKAYQRAAAIL
jgi:DNA-binding FadR family transcriptional regulator